MVTWIWIGGLIVLLGGIIAAWPAKRGMTRLAQRPSTPRRSGATCASPSKSPRSHGARADPARGRGRRADRHGPAARGAPATGDDALEAEVAELEAAKEAKYREIRDAELDHETGKMSDGDWRSLDRTLRAEAVELLKRLDRVNERAESLP